MVDDKSNHFRQLALEEIARQQRFYKEDLDMFGRFLGLRDLPEFNDFYLESPSTSHSHYKIHLKEKKTMDEIKQLLIKQGLKLEKYDFGKPFYEILLKNGNGLFLKVIQPNGLLIYENY